MKLFWLVIICLSCFSGIAAQGDNIIRVEGDCSLIDAIHTANTQTPNGTCAVGSVIQLTGNVELQTVSASQGDLQAGLPLITSNITIDGQGFSITRAADAPSFSLMAIDSTVTLNNITLTGGNGLWVLGDVTLNHVNLVDNSGGGLHIQGGIVTVLDSLIANNTIGSNGGGVSVMQGALIIERSTVENNTAAYLGGGIYGASSQVEIRDSIIRGNVSKQGGGVNLLMSSALITRSLITDNRAEGESPAGKGGGLFGIGSMISVTNTTFLSNTPNAVYNAEAEITLQHVTLFNNPMGIQSVGYNVPGVVKVYNSLLADAVSCIAQGDGQFISIGNLANDSTCQDTSFASGLVAELSAEGGYVPVLSISELSTAVNRGDPAYCLPEDQRGAARDDACDVGAFEFGALADIDGDGVSDLVDICPAAADADQADTDGDGFGDVCDPCPDIFGLVDGCVSTCNITAPGLVNQRAEPSTSAERAGQLNPNDVVQADGYMSNENDGYIWYQLLDDTWVREDVVSAAPECARIGVVNGG